MSRHTLVGALVLVMLAAATFSASSSIAVRQTQEITVTGCLKAGEREGDFVLAIDEKESHRVQAAEGLEIAPHPNHRIELKGTLEKTETGSVLKATALKMIADSCES